MSYSGNSTESAGGDGKAPNADGSTGNEKLMVSYHGVKIVGYNLYYLKLKITIKLIFNLFISRLLSVSDHLDKKKRAGE